MASQNPLSVPGGWNKDSPAVEENNPDKSSVPRSAPAGVVGASGEILTEGGSAIGKLKDTDDLKSLEGKAVTASGDVLDTSGDVLGKADIDQEASDYTTEGAQGSDEKSEKSNGWNVLGKTKGAFGSLGGYGRKSQQPTDAGEGVKDAAEGAADTAADAKDQAQEKAEGAADTAADTKDQAQEKVEDTAETAGDQAPIDLKDEDKPDVDAEGVKDQAEGAKDDAEGAKDDAELPKDADGNPIEDAKDDAEGVKDDAQDKAEDAKDELPKDADGNPIEDAKDEAEGVKDDAQDKAEDAKDELPKDADGNPIEDAKDDLPKDADGNPIEDAKDEAEGVKDDLPKDADGNPIEDAQDKAEDAKDDLPKDADGNPIEDAKDEAEGVKDDADLPKDADGNPIEDAKDNAEETAEGAKDEAEEAGDKLDFSVLKGLKVNKSGNLVNDKGEVIGRIADGDVKKLVGKRADENGDIWNDSGKVVGKAEPLPDSEREDLRDLAPFENFPDAVVEGDGSVTSDGKKIGQVVEGDAKRLKGSKVDQDGDILDRSGNVVGKAEAWDEPEPEAEEPEAEVDNSALAGKRVNKAGNVVDSNGQIFGKLIEGNAASLAGRMCDKDGNVRSESGDIVGKAQLVPEGEREGSKEGPFAELSGSTVSKDGKVVTPSGDVVGRLTQGDGKTLYGRSVDEDGDVLDKNGNVIGKAERWEEPEVEKKKGPFAGLKVNKEGNVLDDGGNVVAKLISGEAPICAGKEIDDDGDVVNSKGQTVGHVSALEDIPPEPEQESAEDKAAREQTEKDEAQAEQDRELAGKLGGAIEQSLEKIKPILKMIEDKVDKAERTPKEELDEEQLVKDVRPLLEEGNKVLTETNGMIRGMDPDGRIQRQAKHKSGTKDASPEEHHLAEQLKELTGGVQQTIDNAKRKIDGMPHAKKELNPLWGLLTEPLGQIIAAVGLLLNGVLGLVGRLLSGLGLGGLLDNLLGGLGLDKILDGLGLGSITGSLTGKK